MRLGRRWRRTESFLDGLYPSALRTIEICGHKVPLDVVACTLDGEGDRACRAFGASRRGVSSRSLTPLEEEVRMGKGFLTGPDANK